MAGGEVVMTGRDTSETSRTEVARAAHEPGAHDLAPGLPPHRPRAADIDERAAKRAEREVAGLFTASAVATLAFVVCFIAVPLESLEDNLLSNVLLGTTLGISLFCIGAGAIHWAKKLMPDEEVVQERHRMRSDEGDRSEAVEAFFAGSSESTIGRRPLVRNSLIGALGLLGLPTVVLLRDLGPLPEKKLRSTIWKPGTRVVVDVTNEPVRPADLQIGGLISAIPENLPEVEEEEGSLNERGKAAVILVRMAPDEIRSQQGDNWDHEGILCFSKICTHVACPISLYEQQTHHLLCPCHQSTFDLADSANVVFGPAARALPQLAITVDDEGYLVARGDFAEPIGPSFWERG
jgi:ubiquinol-cytochrome c reductase iron-sulfur subunit